jgi:hypothetical protein
MAETDYLDGTWRDLATGVNPAYGNLTDADGALDAAGDPGEPINTRLEGPWGLPWFDGLEDVNAYAGLTPSPDVQYPDEAVGACEIVGAYEPAVRTFGPVQAWGLEPSGGLYGEQAVGRIMRFPANIPDRYDPNGVWNVDYRDELAAVVAANSQPLVTDAETTTSLLLWPNVEERY